MFWFYALAAVLLTLAAPPCAISAPPGPPGDLREEALSIFATALHAETCQAAFKTATGQDPRSLYTARRMDLVWSDDAEIAIGWRSYAVTACDGKPLTTMFLPALRPAGARNTARTLLHELVHVGLCGSRLKGTLTGSDEEALADAVAAACVPIDGPRNLPPPKPKEPEAKQCP